MAKRADGSNVYLQASKWIGAEWGSHNCTGFVFTVSANEGHKFRPHPTDPIGPRLSSGELVNQKKANGTYYGDYNYDPPISDKGQVKQEDYSDNWVRVNANNADWLNDVSAGDLIRLKILQNNGVGIYHSGVVSAYDDQTGTLYLVDNWGKYPSSTYNPPSAIIGLSNFSSSKIDSSAPIALYRLNPSSTTQIPSKDDLVLGTNVADILGSGAGNDDVYGNGGNDKLYGNGGNDALYGGTGNDTLYGGTGKDTLYGDANNDILWGGAERDTLTGGGGQDRFSFASKSESSNTVYDYITDFTPGQDKIDVSMIDANTKTGANDAFTFVPFAQSGKLGTITYTTHQGNGFVLADNDGVNGWDFVIQMQANLTVAKGDFIL